MCPKAGFVTSKRTQRVRKSMMRHAMLALAARLLPTSVALAASAAAPTPSPSSAWINRLYLDGRIDRVDQGEVTVERALRVLSDNDVAKASKYPISYDAHLMKLTILDAWTQKPDGAHIPVNPAEIVKQSGIAGTAGTAASFSDFDVDVVPFPQVARGDVVTIRYRLAGDLSWLDSVVQGAATATGPAGLGDARVTLDVPASMTLHADLKAFNEQVEPHGDRKLYRWTYAGDPSSYNTPGSVDRFMSIPHAYVSSIADYDTLGRIYWQHAKASTTPTARTQALAKQITQGRATPRDQAAAIYAWIQSHIRYVASYSGMGAWVPRKPDDVLQTGYGDCKDQAALFQALLKSQGIDSVPVLLEADKDNYALPSIPVTDALNHVITWLPSLDLYADTTSSETPFGVLPYLDTGKPAVLAGERVGLTRTPLASVADMTEIRTTEITVLPDGSAQVNTLVSAARVGGDDVRAAALRLGATGDGKWVKGTIHTGRYNGGADYAFRLPASPAEPAREWVRTHSLRFLQGTHGAFDLAALPAAAGPVGLSNATLGVYGTAARAQPYWCAPRRIEDHITITVPDNVTMVPPSNADIAGEGIAWHASYSATAHRLTATRTLQIDSDRMDCPVAAYAKQKAVVDRIAANFAEQAVYLPTAERGAVGTVAK